MTHSPTTDAACRLLQHDTAYEHTRKPQSPVRLPARCSSWPEGLLEHPHSPVSRLVETVTTRRPSRWPLTVTRLSAA